MPDTYVQIPGGQTGPKVRTVEVGLPQTDTSTQTVEVQAVALADDGGNLLDTAAWQQDVLTELRTLNSLTRTLIAICQAGLRPRSSTNDSFLQDSHGDNT